MRRYVPILLIGALALAGEEPADLGQLVERLGSKDDETCLAAAREAAQVQDKKVTMPLAKLLKHDNVAIRTAAIEALGMRKLADEKKRAAKSLSYRIEPLLKHEKANADELLKICDALHDLAQVTSLKRLLHKIDVNADHTIAAARMHAAANVPAKEVIDELLQIASAGRRGGGRWRNQEALRQLRYATQENVKGGVDEWRRWWSENKATFDPQIAANARADARLKAQEKEKNRRNKKKRKRKEG